jgi:hypothetical protein
LSYDLYLINPDGSERHTGTPWVTTTDLGNGVTSYSFEDATLDATNPNFDHDDVLVEVDASNCKSIKISFKSSAAAWKHRIRLKTLVDGVVRADILLAPNDDLVVGTTKTIDATKGLPGDAVCPAPAQGSIPTTPTAQEPSACILPTRINRLLAPGATGNDVRDLQTLLKCLGFFPPDIAPTRFFGMITQRSITAFKTSHAIPAIGSVGPLTRAALNAYVR